MTPKSLRGDEPHDPRKRQKHTHAYEGQTVFGGTHVLGHCKQRLMRNHPRVADLIFLGGNRFRASLEAAASQLLPPPEEGEKGGASSVPVLRFDRLLAELAPLAPRSKAPLAHYPFLFQKRLLYNIMPLSGGLSTLYFFPGASLQQYASFRGLLYNIMLLKSRLSLC